MTGKDNKFRLTDVLTVSLAHLLHDIYSSFLAPLLPLLINKLGISVFQAGSLDIIRQIPSLFNPLIGLAADKLSVRYVLIIAPVITATGMSLLGIAPHYIAVVILIFMAGIGSALFHVPAPVLIKQVSGDRIGKGMSFYMLGGELARTLGPLVILSAISLWGMEGTYRLIPLGLLASIILCFRLRNFKVARKVTSIDRERIKPTLKKLLPLFAVIAGIIFFRAGLKAALTIYLPTYMSMKGSGLWIAGGALSVLQLAGAGGTFLAGTISDKIGRKNTLMIIALANPLLLWLFIHVQGILLIPVLILNGFFLIGSGPVLLALIHDRDSQHLSLINGIYMSISFALSSLMVMAVGAAVDKYGLDLTYKMAAISALGTIPCVLLLKNIKKEN
ncbi:MAG: MFS transporter [Candidatus Cloacimonetes bacterium]|nr:MFS transporter [Candidatus Cloacimonadota bacterium]